MISTQSLPDAFIDFTRNIYGTGDIPLHRPLFEGNEKKYLDACIDSNFVSSVGSKVREFEKQIAEYTGAQFAIATVNGTAALHISLLVAGVRRDEEVLTQAVTFVATCNSISYVGAQPAFIDVDIDTLGMSPIALDRFLQASAVKRAGTAWNKHTGRRIAACVPMHTFGLPNRIVEIAEICRDWGISLVEDAAESLGSFSQERHTGTTGLCGVLSFNGNKIITTGGGGMIITNDESIAHRAKHLTTTAKLAHPYEFYHDEAGYNYRLPNLNAALGCAQMEQLTHMLAVKGQLAAKYHQFFGAFEVAMPRSLPGCVANNWLNAIILSDRNERNAFLSRTNAEGVMTRPIWRLMCDLPMYRNCQHDGLKNSRWLEERVVNVPSSVPDGSIETGH
jgi:aminotransferase in exopolysaccharide biosynthesis